MNEGENNYAGFHSVHLKNWRNFGLLDTDLGRRNFIIGANATGKSNFLDALCFFRDLAKRDGGFQQAVDSRGGVRSIRSLSARKGSDIIIGCKVVDMDGGHWEYELRFGLRDLHLQVLRERIKINSKAPVIRDTKEEDDVLRSQTWLQQVTMNKEWRGLVDTLGSIRYINPVPQIIRDNELRSASFSDSFGREMLERMSREGKDSQDVRLNKIADALREAVPNLDKLKVTRDKLSGRPHIMARFEHWRPQGAWHDEMRLSDGTLRLITILWELQERSGPVLIEEPEMSLHPELIAMLPGLFARVGREKNRQVIVSTHSPDILRDPGIAPAEVKIFKSSSEGTQVTDASAIPGVDDALRGGLLLSEMAMSQARPRIGKLSPIIQATSVG